MTDLEENCWSKDLCQNCGTELRSEKEHALTQDGTTKSYCSDLCNDEGMKRAMVTAPVFVAPATVTAEVQAVHSKWSAKPLMPQHLLSLQFFGIAFEK